MIRSSLFCAASVLTVAAASPAFAQSPAVPADEDNAIIVTAQLREQSIVDVPIAITALDGEFIERLGVSDFEEVSRYIPGFEVQNQSPNNPGFVMRGITSDTGTAFGEPRVSVYQDGVSISKSRGSYVELFDMERIEVARGPQSTLYGRGALIGAVNLVQNKANPRAAEGMARIAYGNLDYFLAEGMVNVPLGETAAVRVAGRYRQRDGHVENLLGTGDFNSVQTGAVRGALRFQPAETITVDVIGNYQEDHPNGTSFKSLSYVPTDPATGAVLGTSEPHTGATLAPGAGFEDGAPLGLDRKVWGVTGIVNADLSDALRLTSITAYREFDSLEIFDADGTSLPILTAAENAYGEQFSQELRLTFQADRLTAFIGGAYFWENGFQRTPAQFDERAVLARLTGALNGPPQLGLPANVPAPLPVFGNTAFTAALLRGAFREQIAGQVPAGIPGRDAIIDAQLDAALPAAVAQAVAANLSGAHWESSTNYGRTRAFDVFADAAFEVTDRLELGVGVRYTRDDKRSGIQSSVGSASALGGLIAIIQGQADPAALLPVLAQPGTPNLPAFGLGSQPTANNGDIIYSNLKDDGFTWRLNARYAIAPDSSLYASYARGRRPELLSAGTPAAPFGAARFNLVEAEQVDSFEIGAKTETLGRTLYLDGALFYYRYDNFQTTIQQGTLFVTTNAGEAESYGVELQARWSPNDNLSLFGTYAWNRSRFKAGIYEGNRFRLSPDHTLSFGGTVGFDVGRGRVDFTPSVTYQSKVFFDDDNDRPDLQTMAFGALVPDLVQDEFQDGFALVNARLGYSFDGAFRIEAFAANLLNEKYIKDAGNTGDALGLPTFIAGEPRTYGVQMSIRF